MALLTGLFLQSCGNLALSGPQSREKLEKQKKLQLPGGLRIATPKAAQQSPSAQMASPAQSSMALTDSRGRNITFEYATGGQWKATVKEITGKRVLPVTFGPGYSMERLQGLEKSYQKQCIHVLEKGVYVGEQGLKGGMMGAELTGTAGRSIGDTLRYQGSFQQERRHEDGTLELYDDQYDTDGQARARLEDGKYVSPSDAARSFTQMGKTHYDAGRHQEALEYHTQALEIRRSLYPDQNHVEVGQSLFNVGEAYRHLGRHQEAVEVARSLNEAGVTCHNLGRHQEALRHFEQALEMRRALYPNQNHEDVAQSLNNVGAAYDNLGRHQAALEHFEQALRMRRALYPNQNHEDVAQSLNSVGFAYGRLVRYQESLEYFEQALEMRRALYPNQNHEDVAQSLNNVGAAYSALGRHQESLRHCEQALEMRRALYPGQNHEKVAQSLNNVGVGCHKLGRHQDARKYYEKALAMYRQLYPTQPNHPDFKRTRDNLNKLP